MSDRLKKLVQDKALKIGKNWRTKLAADAGVSTAFVSQIANGTYDHAPRPEHVRQLALACGCSDEEALALARECFPEARTA